MNVNVCIGSKCVNATSMAKRKRRKKTLLEVRQRTAGAKKAAASASTELLENILPQLPTIPDKEIPVSSAQAAALLQLWTQDGGGTGHPLDAVEKLIRRMYFKSGKENGYFLIRNGEYWPDKVVEKTIFWLFVKTSVVKKVTKLRVIAKEKGKVKNLKNRLTKNQLEKLEKNSRKPTETAAKDRLHRKNTTNSVLQGRKSGPEVTTGEGPDAKSIFLTPALRGIVTGAPLRRGTHGRKNRDYTTFGTDCFVLE